MTYRNNLTRRSRVVTKVTSCCWTLITRVPVAVGSSLISSSIYEARDHIYFRSDSHPMFVYVTICEINVESLRAMQKLEVLGEQHLSEKADNFLMFLALSRFMTSWLPIVVGSLQACNLLSLLPIPLPSIAQRPCISTYTSLSLIFECILLSLCKNLFLS